MFSLAGIACDSTSLKVWVVLNLADFIEQSTIQDLTAFNQNFSKVRM